MLYALAHPVLLLGLVMGFVVAVCLHGALQARLLAWAGQPAPLRDGDGSPSPRRHIDPFGAVLALLGVGYGRPLDVATLPRDRSARLDVALLGPALLLVVLGAGASAGVLVAAGVSLPPGVGFVPVLRGDLVPASPGVQLALGAALVPLLVGLLHLVPVPPLDAGRVLLAHGGWTAGWQRFRQWFDGSQWGVVALLVASILPVGLREPPLLFLLDVASSPVGAVARAVLA